jgi:polygalacturonase
MSAEDRGFPLRASDRASDCASGPRVPPPRGVSYRYPLSVRDFGASGKGRSPDTAAIQRAIDYLSSAGGGILHFPAGTYLTGSIFLKSGVGLELDPGSVLAGSEDPEDYPIVETRWEGKTRAAHSALIHAAGQSDISVTGPGLIDGRGAVWWRRFRAGELAHPRPRLLAFEDCAGVRLAHFHAVDSPSWTINPVRCRDVLIFGVSIDNPPDSPNTHGINPDSCSQVRISACRVNVGDDCITIKSGSEAEAGHLVAPCEKIVISDCILESGHGAIVIGSEMSGGVRDIVVSNCVFDGTDRGIRMKSRRGRGGRVERVRVSNIVMRNVLVPFTINMHYACGARGELRVSSRDAFPVDAGTPSFSDISFGGITATGVGIAACHIEGLAESPVGNLSFSDVDISVGGEAPPADPEMSEGIIPRARAGFVFSNVDGLWLDKVRVRGQDGPGFILDACRDLHLSSCHPAI